MTVDFDSSVPINFASDHLSTDPQTTGFAGSFRLGDRYEFTLPIRSSHTGITFSTDFLVMGALSVSRARSAELTFGDVRAEVRFSRTGAQASNGTVTPVGSGELADGRPFVRYRYTIDLPPTGRNLHGEVVVHGFTKYQQDALGIDNVDVTLQAPGAATPIALAMGDVVAPTPDGSRGVIEQHGALDLYTFTIPTDGYVTTIEALTGPGLQYPCDQLMLREVETGTLRDGCITDTELAAGDYELQMTAAPGALLPYRYGFHIVGPQLPQEFGPVEVGLQPVVLDASTGGGVGHTEGRDDYHIFHLDVEESGLLTGDLTCTPIADYECQNLVAVSGGSTFTQSSHGVAVDVEPGSYDVYLYPMNGPEDYSLTLSVASDEPTELQMGDVVVPTPGTDLGVLKPGDLRDRFTFEVPTGGTTVTLGLLPAYDQLAPSRYGYPDWVCKSWKLRSESWGNFNACLTNSWLPEGSYTLDVFAPDLEAFPYKYGFELYTPDQVHSQAFPVELSVEDPLEVEPDVGSGQGILQSLASSDVYTFTATGFGRLHTTVTCDDATEGVTCPGAVLSSTDGGWVNPDTADLVPGRTYAIKVSGGAGGHHTYSLQAGVRQPYSYTLGDDVTPGSLGAGSGTWSDEEDLDFYSFTVPPSGIELGSDWQGRMGGWTLYDATGTPVDAQWNGGHYTYQLDGGDYVAAARAPWVDEPDQPYSFRLLRRGADGPGADGHRNPVRPGAGGGGPGPERDRRPLHVHGGPGGAALDLGGGRRLPADHPPGLR